MDRAIERMTAQQPTCALSESVLSVCAHENSASEATSAYLDTAYAVSFFAFYFYCFSFYYLRGQRKQAIAA